MRKRLLCVIAAATAVVGCSGSNADESATTAVSITLPTTIDSSIVVGASDVEPPAAAAVVHSEVIVGEARVPKVVARKAPADTGEPLVELDNPTEVGSPLVFQLLDTDIAEGNDWVEVKLPIRPNGTTGWVRISDLSLSRNPYRIEVDASQHQLKVFERGELWISTTVAIGTGETPTPRGSFYITELLQPPNPNGLYGPYAFGLSGFSENLQSFRGGEAVIGIHGTNEPEALGSDVSHGCIRLANDVITELAGVIPLGTPVDITG